MENAINLPMTLLQAMTSWTAGVEIENYPEIEPIQGFSFYRTRDLYFKGFRKGNNMIVHTKDGQRYPLKGLPLFEDYDVLLIIKAKRYVVGFAPVVATKEELAAFIAEMKAYARTLQVAEHEDWAQYEHLIHGSIKLARFLHEHNPARDA